MIVGYDSRTKDGELVYAQARELIVGAVLSSIRHNQVESCISMDLMRRNRHQFDCEVEYVGSLRLYPDRWELTKPGV